MSRVHTDQKWCNMPRRSKAEVAPSPITTYYPDGIVQTWPCLNAHQSFTSWLAEKYGISYRQYRNKKKHIRVLFREEYIAEMMPTDNPIYERSALEKDN